MSAPASTPFSETVRWLAAHAGFPARRLPGKAELLVLIATAAAIEEVNVARTSPHAKVISNPTYNAQLRNYTAQRRRAHINSDNSAKT